MRLTRPFALLVAALVLGCLACLALVFTVTPPLSPNVQSGFATSTALAGTNR